MNRIRKAVGFAPHRIAGVRIAPAVSLVLLISALAFTTSLCRAQQLQPQTVAAFENYIRAKEILEDRELGEDKTFLQIDALPEAERREAYSSLQRGQVIAEEAQPPCDPAACAHPPSGMIHDWVGIVFVPGVSIRQTLTALENYDRDAVYYRPEVVQSKLLAASGDDFHVFLRLRQTEVITVVFDTEYDVRYTYRDATHAYSRSHSTRISEVEDAGTAEEHDRAPGDDHGFLWRLYSYWRFYEVKEGVYIQCDAVSLTRDVPIGLGWMVRPFLEKYPPSRCASRWRPRELL